MNFSNVCRTCLRTECLNPIFKDEDDHDKYSSAVYLATGVQVHINDNLPQNMCSECVKHINSALKFRKQCKRVENELLRIKSERKLTSDVRRAENVAVYSHDVHKTGLLNGINIPKIELNNILDIKEEEFTVEPLISILKTEEYEHDIKIRKNSFDATENLISDSLYNDNKMKTDEIDIKNTEQSAFIENSMEEVKISFVEIENGATDTFLNDNESDNDMKTDNERLNTKISLDETKIGLLIPIYSTNYSNTIDNDMKTDVTITKNIKTKRKTSKNVDFKPLNDNTECIPYKNTTNETVENEKVLELPYNVLPGGKYDKITRVLCKVCGKELSIRSIDSHMTRCHPGADERKVKCELCDNHVMKEKLKRHISMMHGNAYRCGYCKSEFDGRLVLVEHVKKCTAKKRRASKAGREMTECDQCHQKMQKASLRTHKATMHAGLRPVCEHCGVSFGNKLRLREHCRAKHGYDKLKCERCDFASASLLAMRNHERRHRGEKPFVCETCGVGFHAAYLLQQHRHSHRSDKTVTCDECPARFKAANSLHVHKATCHSARAYRCGLCARAYRCRHYALKHLRHVHRHYAAPPPLVPVTGDDTTGDCV